MFVWYGTGTSDVRTVSFSHRDQMSIAAAAYGSTLQWLGDEGFELVSHQMVPLTYDVTKETFGEFKVHPTLGEVLTFKRMLPPA